MRDKVIHFNDWMDKKNNKLKKKHQAILLSSFLLIIITILNKNRNQVQNPNDKWQVDSNDTDTKSKGIEQKPHIEWNMIDRYSVLK